jgi:hypothetical protein
MCHWLLLHVSSSSSPQINEILQLHTAFYRSFNTCTFWYDLNPTINYPSYLVWFGRKDNLVERTSVMEIMPNATFNNISDILGGGGLIFLQHNVVSNTPHHEQDSNVLYFVMYYCHVTKGSCVFLWIIGSIRKCQLAIQRVLCSLCQIPL